MIKWLWVLPANFFIIFFGIPAAWENLKTSGNYAYSDLWRALLVIQLIPIGFLIIIFITDVIEPIYKKFYKYDIYKRKWIRK